MKLIDLTRINQLIDGLLDKINDKYATKAELDSGLKGKANKEHGTHLELGTTSSTAFRGDYGNTAYKHSQAAHAPSNAQKNSDITKAEIEAKLTGNITSHSHTISDATTSASGLMSKEDKVKLNSIDSKANSIDVYTKAELDKILEELPSNSESVMSFTKDITNAQWVKEDNLYKVKIKHNLSAKNVLVSVIDKDSGENILSTFKIVDVNNIEIYSSYSFNATISILNTKVNTLEEDSNSNVDIDDEVVSEDSTWSSKKIEENITMNDGTTVKDAINANKTSILNNGNIANQALEKANEAFQLGVNAKKSVVQAINSKKTVPDVSSNNSWDELTQSITNIKEASGNAVAANVLSGKTFTNSDGVEYTGTMTNRGTHTETTDYIAWNDNSVYMGIPAGAYITPSGVGVPEIFLNKSKIENLSPGNIKSGVSIFGVTGNVVPGKKWASGTVNVTMNQNRTANTYPYDEDSQSNDKMPRLTVTGLKFKPSYVIILQSKEAANTPAYGGFACILSPICNYLWQSDRDVTRYLYTDNPNVIGITSNGFTSVFPLNFNPGTYWWIAYE